MSQIEKRGKPTISITSSGFVRDAHWSARIFGCPELQLMEVPQPITNQPEALIHQMVDAAIEQAIAGLTQGVYAPDEARDHHVHVAAPVLRYQGSDLLDCFDRMNAVFIEAGWSDGMPLVPPTRAKVEAMVSASGRRADEVVGVFEPGFGIGTVGKIAANAVMAGCTPEAFPVVLAAAECLLEPRLGTRSFAMSTGPQAPVIFVSGPYAQRIGMNHGVCALGPGSPSAVNVSIGRALRLVLMNVGLAYPGISDMDTIGTPLKFSACVAENEAATPWEFFRVSKGFGPETTTVTVHVPYGVVEVFDFQNTEPEKLARSFALALCNAPQTSSAAWLSMKPGPKDGPGPYHGDYEFPFMVCPDHAEVFRNAGWSRRRVQEEIFRHCRMPFEDLIHQKPPRAFQESNPHMQWLYDAPKTEISLFKRAEDIDLFVVGAQAGRSLYWTAGSAGVTRPVRLPG